MKEVLNCRCGGLGHIRNDGGMFSVECVTCHVCTFCKKTLDDAIDEWNRIQMNYHKFITSDDKASDDNTFYIIIKYLFYKVEQAPCREAATYCLDIAKSLFEEFSDNFEFDEKDEILQIWKRAVLKINHL